MDEHTAEVTAASPAGDSAELEALAGRARAGDTVAFDELARRLARRMMAFARRSISDRELAEEVVQESLVRMYRALPRYEHGNFLAWCFTIVRHCAQDAAKRERRRAHLQLVEAPVTHDPTEAVDVRAAVEEALARLPEHLRSTFLLHQQGLSYADVAGVLEVPLGTVRSRLSEARRSLRAALTTSLQRRNPT